MREESIINEKYSNIEELLTQPGLVIYYDFENIKNSKQLIDGLLTKAKRLNDIGFTSDEIIKIIFYGDNLQDCFLNKEHINIFKLYIKNNMS